MVPIGTVVATVDVDGGNSAEELEHVALKEEEEPVSEPTNVLVENSREEIEATRWYSSSREHSRTIDC